MCVKQRRLAPKPQTKITIKYLHTLITCNTRAEHLSRELLPHFANPFQIHAPSMRSLRAQIVCVISRIIIITQLSIHYFHYRRHLYRRRRRRLWHSYQNSTGVVSFAPCSPAPLAYSQVTRNTHTHEVLCLPNPIVFAYFIIPYEWH